MRTYSERLANIKAKAQANKKAKRAIAASAVSLCALVLLIGGVMLHPALLLGQCFVPTVGPALQQPSVNDTPTDNTVPIHPGASEQDPTGPVIMGPTTPEDVLEFRYTSVKCPYGSSYSWGPVIIRSKEELQLLYEREIAQFEDWILEFDPIASVREQINQYDDAFFADNALVVLMNKELGSINGCEATDVFWAGRTLYINVNRKVPAIGTTDTEYWYLFVEVTETLPKHTDVCVQYMVNDGWMQPAWRAYEISFDSQTIDYGTPDFDGIYPRTDVIRSVVELQMYLAGLRQDLSAETAKYDEAFFEKHTLLALWNTPASSSKEYRVTNIWRMDDYGVYICGEIFEPEICTGDVMSRLILIEADEKISHYAKIVVDYQTHTEITPPETMDPTRPTDPTKPTEPPHPPQPPIEYVQSIQMQTQTIYYGAPDVNFERPHTDVVLSAAELQSYLAELQLDLSAETANYDEAFFERHTLLLLWNMTGSSSVTYTVTQGALYSDGHVYILGEIYKPEICCDDTMSWLILIEAEAEISKDAKIIVDYNHVQEAVPPERPENTNLEFWIGQNVADYDFSGHEEVYGLFGAQQYLGSGYNMLVDGEGQQTYPEHYVSYLVGAFPDESDGGSFVTNIEICDADVVVYGLTIQSDAEEFEALFRAMGYSVYEKNGTWIAQKNGITFTFRHGVCLSIRADVTNWSGILY